MEQVEYLNTKTGKTLSCPKMLWEKMHSKNPDFQLLTADIREPMKPTPIKPLDVVRKHIDAVKTEACCKEFPKEVVDFLVAQREAGVLRETIETIHSIMGTKKTEALLNDPLEADEFNRTEDVPEVQTPNGPEVPYAQVENKQPKGKGGRPKSIKKTIVK